MSKRNDSPEESTDAGSRSRTNAGGRREGQPATEEITEKFTFTFLRLGVAIIGLVLLVFALGEIVGVDMFSVFGNILSSRVGQWLIVAIFGLGLIIAASKRWMSSGV